MNNSLSNLNQQPVASTTTNKPPQYVSNIITMNVSNYIGNSTYRYRFPTAATFKSGDQIMMNTLSIYNSTFNISSTYANNQFYFYFPPTNRWYTFTIPNGYYSIEDLNLFFQVECLRQNLYAKKGSQIVYFAKLSTNLNQYKAQVDTYVVPSDVDNTTISDYGYTIDTPKTGGVTWTWGTTTRAAGIYFSRGLATLLGFTTRLNAIYTTGTTNASFLSNTYASLSPIFNYVVTCNLVYSPYNIPPNIMTQVPIENSFGSLITYKGTADSALSINPGTYSELVIQLLDQNYNLLPINDPESTFSLIIKYQV